MTLLCCSLRILSANDQIQRGRGEISMQIRTPDRALRCNFLFFDFSAVFLRKVVTAVLVFLLFRTFEVGSALL